MKIFIRRATFALFVAALCMQGCDGDDPPNPTTQPTPSNQPPPIDIPYPNQTGCLLKSIIRNDVQELHFTYDKKGYALNTAETNNAEFSLLQTVFEYDKSRKIISQQYFYDNYPTPTLSFTLFQYKDGLVNQAVHLLSEDSVVYIEKFTYDELNRLIRITNTYKSNKTFTYNAQGNIIETTLTTGTETLRIVYSDYDDKLTPLQSATGYLNLYSPGKNNPGSSAIYQNGVLVKEVIYTYQYNEKNLPTRITETSSD